MNVQMRVRFHNSSTRSHASEEENRTRNGGKNLKCQPVNSMSFIWNDNMREKREANANAT
jgi:hypothetical protein